MFFVGKTAGKKKTNLAQGENLGGGAQVQRKGWKAQCHRPWRDEGSQLPSRLAGGRPPNKDITRWTERLPWQARIRPNDLVLQEHFYCALLRTAYPIESGKLPCSSYPGQDDTKLTVIKRAGASFFPELCENLFVD